MRFISSLYNFVINPHEEINKIMQERNISLAFLGYFIGSFSIVLTTALNHGGTTPWKFVFLTLFCLFFTICVSFFFASASHLFLELTTGKGRAAGLFVLLGLSEFAKTLLVAYALIALAIPLPNIVKSIVVLGVLLLQLIFILYMMQQVYGLSKKITFFALLISFVPSFICFFTFSFGFLFLIFWAIFA